MKCMSEPNPIQNQLQSMEVRSLYDRYDDLFGQLVRYFIYICMGNAQLCDNQFSILQITLSLKQTLIDSGQMVWIKCGYGIGHLARTPDTINLRIVFHRICTIRIA